MSDLGTKKTNLVTGVVGNARVMPRKNRLKFLAFGILIIAVIAASVGVYKLSEQNDEKEDGVYKLKDGGTSVFSEEETNRRNEQFLQDNPDFINDDYSNIENDDGNVQ